MDVVTAIFARWEHGWELTLEGDAEVCTQCVTLAAARQQVRDYLDTVAPEVDHSDWAVTLQPADPALAERVTVARAAARDAEVAQERADRESRALVAQLSSAGHTGTEIAAILDITRGRARRLAQEPTEP